MPKVLKQGWYTDDNMLIAIGLTSRHDKTVVLWT